MTSNTVDINRLGELEYITFPKLTKCGAVRHAFTTRLGGASNGFFSSMNMSFHRNDDALSVRENYRRICSAVGIDVSHLVLSHQTHTNNVLAVTRRDCGIGFSRPDFEDIDGLVTAESGVALVTQYADCTPLLFCDPINRVIATSHAGWRGTASMIGAVTVEKLVRDFNCKRENIIAAIGPCIGNCCYEVDDPVYNEFLKMPISLDKVFVPKENGRYMLDLKLANKRILNLSGIPDENIDVADICTCCNSDTMFSHRALGSKRGNLAAIIELI